MKREVSASEARSLELDCAAATTKLKRSVRYPPHPGHVTRAADAASAPKIFPGHVSGRLGAKPEAASLGRELLLTPKAAVSSDDLIIVPERDFGWRSHRWTN
jgi:hypothetical protein